MRKLREAAVVAAAVGTVTLLGVGTAVACGGEKHHHAPEPTPSVSITCNQDTGDNTATDQTATGTVAGVNVSDALNGGDADSSANQQLCGLSNDNAENTAGDSTGGAGGAVGTIL